VLKGNTGKGTVSKEVIVLIVRWLHGA
jgi:hypothetical protein